MTMTPRANSEPCVRSALVAPALPLPARRRFAFHRNLADHLLLGVPLEAPLEDSVQVVNILEAAALSASDGGSPVKMGDG